MTPRSSPGACSKRVSEKTLSSFSVGHRETPTVETLQFLGIAYSIDLDSGRQHATGVNSEIQKSPQGSP